MVTARFAPLSQAVLAVAAVKTLFHLFTFQGYGIFRDEMYFVACARHLSWGFVDHPPFAPAMMAISTGLLGDSLFAVRFWPAVLGGLPVVLAALMARELGGRTYAQLLAGIAAAVAPIWLALHHDFTIVMWEPVFWTAGALVVARLIRTGNPKLWLWFGAACGVGLLNKTSVAVFGFGLVAALLLTKQRRLLWTPWLFAGGALAGIIAAPFLIWQALHGWPQAEFVSNAAQFKNIALSPAGFFFEQIIQFGPPALLIWLAGLGFLILGRQGQYRPLGLAWLIMFGLFVVMHGKSYYLAPYGHVLMGAGAVAWESWFYAPKWKWARAALALFVCLSLSFLPLAVPVLPAADYIAYAARLGMDRSSGERHETAALPQHYADMHGWKEMVEEVARVYDSLPPEDQAKARIFARNYGEAGAIDYFGAEYGLPPAISGHNSYWVWGYGDFGGEVLIVIGGDRPGRFYEEVEAAGRIHHEYAMPYESGLTVWICREPKLTIAEVWPQIKNFN